MKTLKVLGIHGLGDHRGTTWQADWEAALRSAFPGQGQIDLRIKFLPYDDLFETVDLSVWETMQAFWKLSRSGVSSLLRRRRGLVGDVSDRIRWTAGYVVAWLEDDAFQVKTRSRVLDTLVAEQPDIILAHSLGSMITYNAFSHRDASRADVASALGRCHYVTFGSQIGNPFVVGNLTAGRVEALPVKFWHHLYNANDDVLTAEIRLWGATNFRQIETPFDMPGFGDHAPVEYIRHVQTIESVWRPLAEQRINSRSFGAARTRRESPTVLAKKGRLQHRALLVGINDYPDKNDRLEGCVNDAFLMSSVLQECGFQPECIRVCLDRRATTKGITDRLEWLLDDPRPGDERVFYYSGHGATIPQYGRNAEPDRKTETLVPSDFDWSPEKSIVDDQIFSLYSQLPYGTRFTMILDCCHSGGMHRQGGARVRGLTAPDDIRHRELKWDRKSDMWVERDFERLNRRFSSHKEETAKYFGQDGVSTRLGRASLVRGEDEAEYQRRKRREGSPKIGPYLPLILEACAEKELSYEYRHGVTSFGAFTYSLCLELRKHKRITFAKLVDVTRARLADLGYEQKPQILGPKSVMRSRVPWHE